MIHRVQQWSLYQCGNCGGMMIEPSQRERRPPFVLHQEFLETPFESRFQGVLQLAWRERSWHVIAAVPGSGKSLGIADLVLHSGAYKDATGTTRLPVLAIRAPKNAAREQALGIALAAAFGVLPKMTCRIFAPGSCRLWLLQG